jgi:predicted MPP superfamily phosphohydrolase
MADQPSKIRDVAWSELFPWLILLRSIRIALLARVLVLGAIGLFATWVGWRVITDAFPETTDPVVLTWSKTMLAFWERPTDISPTAAWVNTSPHSAMEIVDSAANPTLFRAPLTIWLYLTDLHMSGRIQPAFYERVVEVINEAEPDIVAVTGDIVEGDAFIEWLPSTLGKLRARHGVYYVLGNHDRRASEATLKQQLAECNLVHLGDNWRQILVNEVPLILAGNELPWYAPAADLSNCVESRSHGRLMRILLAHSPDQLLWARTNDIDLMLAGHLHGGQVRFPIVGAITSPSAFGVRYAAGIFRAGNTIMHVSRGVGALTPIRVNCPPEIALLRLCCGAGDA